MKPIFRWSILGVSALILIGLVLRQPHQSKHPDQQPPSLEQPVQAAPPVAPIQLKPEETHPQQVNGLSEDDTLLSSDPTMTATNSDSTPDESPAQSAFPADISNSLLALIPMTAVSDDPQTMGLIYQMQGEMLQAMAKIMLEYAPESSEAPNN